MAISGTYRDIIRQKDEELQRYILESEQARDRERQLLTDIANRERKAKEEAYLFMLNEGMSMEAICKISEMTPEQLEQLRNNR